MSNAHLSKKALVVIRARWKGFRLISVREGAQKVQVMKKVDQV